MGPPLPLSPPPLTSLHCSSRACAAERKLGAFTATDPGAESNTPVVVMFGWTGSRDKTLRTYARALWHDNGMPVVRGIAPHW